MNEINSDDLFECAELEFKRYEDFFDFESGSLLNIYKSDDFSFFVKYSSFLELVLGQAIFSQIDHPLNDSLKMAKFVNSLDINNHRSGKIKLAQELDILGKEEANFARKFTEQRNQLVHSGNLLFFNLSDDIARRSKNEMKDFIKAYTCDQSTGDQSEFFGEPIAVDLVQAYPKEFILTGFMSLLEEIDRACCNWKHDVEKSIFINRSFKKSEIVGVNYIDDSDLEGEDE